MQGVLLHKIQSLVASPVFIWGNCRSQGFGIVTTTEQDPILLDDEDLTTHDYCREKN